MTIPALYALKFRKVVIGLVLFAVILSGTRGIWLAFLAPIVLSLFLFRRIKLWKHFLIFILLFSIAYPIFASPQFNLENSDLLARRIRSIIDWSETSNSGRLAIWRLTTESIAKRPALGVGVGNFPVVLDEAIYATRAGASAHNLYLHIAAEMGLFAMFTFLYLMFWIGRKAYLLTKSRKELISNYSLAVLLYFTWVFAYFMTDVTLFDERVFLILGTQIAVIYGLEK
jgi:putative inorganic carbon (HCO3(-)) transporter